MYIRPSTALLSVVSFAGAVAAAPNAVAARQSSECDTGSNQCCNSLQSATSTNPISELLGLLGVDLGSIIGQVGLTCNPIVGENGCTQQPVCCNGDTFYGGLIVIGCSPISL